VAVAAGGCVDPLTRQSTEDLRAQILQTHRREIQGLEGTTQAQTQRTPSDLYLNKNASRLKDLDAISGPDVYKKLSLPLTPALDNKPSAHVTLSLEQAIRSAARNNVDIRLAQIQPGIDQAALEAAEAAFDAVFFTETSFQKQNRPRSSTTVNGIPVGAADTTQDTSNLTTGIRKPLDTGGQVTLSTGFDYVNNKTGRVDLTPDPAWTSRVLLGVTQPVLRNFGAPANRAQIALSRNAVRRDALSLQAQMLTVLGDVEQAYWRLSQARHTLAIQQHLLEMMIETRTRVEKRQAFDVSSVQVAQANSFVLQQQADVLRAAQAVRVASDDLKKLINDPNLPLSDEALIVPSDEPVEQPVAYNLLDAVTMALRKRPEPRGALLAIDDASIRMTVADNQTLPLLELNAQIEYFGLDTGLEPTYRALTDGQFIEYLVGGRFEAPIGNRAAEADLRRTRIERHQATVQYRKATLDVVQTVKSTLRDVQTSWQLIEINRDTRRATAENLRALLEREQTGEALTPEFLLSLKLDTQRRLASAEQNELAALIDYNIALARHHQAVGTLLEHNQIEFVWPLEMFENREIDPAWDAGR
jgi:outer membrane protein TolC